MGYKTDPNAAKPDSDSTDSEAKPEGSVVDSEKKDSEPTTESDSEKNEDGTPKEKEWVVKEKRTKKHTYKLEIVRSAKSHKAFNEFPELMSNGKTILKMFKEYEEKKFKDAESKNRLESLMYAIPEITEDTDLMNFGTPVEMEKLRQDAKDLDDWFFEDEAFHADYKVFDAKHDGLRKQINRLQFRKNESEGREGLVQVLDARILQSSNNIGEMTTTRPWIPKEKIDSA